MAVRTRTCKDGDASLNSVATMARHLVINERQLLTIDAKGPCHSRDAVTGEVQIELAEGVTEAIVSIDDQWLGLHLYANGTHQDVRVSLLRTRDVLAGAVERLQVTLSH